MWRSASKSAAATPEAGGVVGQPKRSRGVLESAVPFVQEQDVMNALGPDHRRGQKEVEQAVAVGVKCRDGRAEPGADAADDRERSGEVRRFDPTLTVRRSLTAIGWAASKFSGTDFGLSAGRWRAETG